MRGNWAKPNGEAPAEVTAQGDDLPDIDPGPCASVPRHRFVTAMEVRHASGPWEAFQFRDMATRSEFSPTQFTVIFEGREERWRVTVKGRNLHGIYSLILQHRLEWIQAAVRDFAADGQPIVTSVDVVPEKVKG